MAPSGVGLVSKSHIPEGPCAHLPYAPVQVADLVTTEYRSLGTRFEKLAVNYVAMWLIAIMEKALKRLFPDRA
jgi:hypothetical protein